MRSVLVLLFALSGCSHAAASSFTTTERQTAKIEALTQIVKSEDLAVETREVIRAAPVRTIIEEAWDEPTPTPEEPNKVKHHPKKKTIEAGPVDTTKTADYKRDARQEEQKAVKVATDNKKGASGARSSSTSLGPPWWVWLLIGPLALGVLVGVKKLGWLP